MDHKECSNYLTKSLLFGYAIYAMGVSYYVAVARSYYLESSERVRYDEDGMMR
jgi:hypothetical protein